VFDTNVYIILSPPHNKKRPQDYPVVLNAHLYLAIKH